MDMTDLASFNSLTGVEVSLRRLFAGRPVSGRPASPNVGHFLKLTTPTPPNFINKGII